MRLGSLLPLLLLVGTGCVSRMPVARDDTPVIVRTSAIGGGVTHVRDEPRPTGLERTGHFVPGRGDPNVHWKFVTWCPAGQSALSGACESRGADGELTASFPETGVVDYQMFYGWGCTYARVAPDDSVQVRVRCQ